MAEFIDPAIVPKVTLPSGEEVPCMGMGTFGSDRVTQKMYLQQLQEQSAADIVCLTVQHAMEMSIRSVKFLKQQSKKAS